MSLIAKTEAVVLRTMKYRETSKIVTFYTRQFGKISGLVKGARRPKSTFGSSLEPMSHVSLVVYKKEGRELQTIAQCDLVKSFRRLSDDISKMAVGMSIVEIIHHISHDEEENGPLFMLVVQSLNALNETLKHPSNILWQFELKLMDVLGFKPTFDRCVECEKSLSGKSDPITFHLGKGGPLCDACAAVPVSTASLSSENVQFLDKVNRNETVSDSISLDTDTTRRAEIDSFLRAYLRFHVAGIRTLKSERVFSQIMEST